jgi:hypothetical protein
MNFSILSIILSTIYTIVILILTAKLLSYDFIITKLIYLGVVLLPAIMMIIIFLQEYWIIIGLLATIPTSKIPLPLLDALSFNYVINTGLLFLVIAGITINKRLDKRGFDGFASKAMLIFFLWSSVRFVYDHPGAGSTGTTGGLSAALPVVLSGACYLSTIYLSLKLDFKQKHIKALWLGLIICMVEVAYKNLTQFIPLGGFVTIFSFPVMWFAAMLAATYPLSKTKDNIFKNELFLSILSIGIILFSLISKNRLPLVTTAVALGLAYNLYHATYKYIRILVPAAIVIVSLAIFTPDLIPKSAVRTLSLVAPEHFSKMKTSDVGEIGWESNWRTTLARIAWYDMKKKPLTGKGFSFSFEELQYNAEIAKLGDSGRFGGLLSSGGYHNSILFLGVKLGIPATILFILAIINIYSRFLVFSKRLNCTLQKQFCVMLASAFVCVLGKMLTNGHALDVFNISIMIGIMQGIMLKEPTDDDEEDDAPDKTRKESLGDSLMIKHIERKNRIKTYKR